MLIEIFYQLLQAWRFQFFVRLTTIVGSLLKRISPPPRCAAAWLCAVSVLPMVGSAPALLPALRTIAMRTSPQKFLPAHDFAT
jgi:hypothetical protein